MGQNRKQSSAEEAEALRVRLEEAEDTLRAIRHGEVDALVVSGPDGEHLFTLEGAEHPYRIFVEAMKQGAVTLGSDGTIFYCNQSFSDLVLTPIESVIGSSIFKFVGSEETRIVEAAFTKGLQTGSGVDSFLSRNDGAKVPVHLSFSRLKSEGEIGTLVVTDLSERKEAEDALRASEKQLRALSSQLFTIQEDERRRIARGLHNGLQQTLTAIKFKVESFLQETSEGRTNVNLQPLEAVIPIVQECVREMSRIQNNLRPSILDDLGILAGISYLTRKVEEMIPGIFVEKQFDIGERDVPESLKAVIYRILQETLNNVLKHSRADHVGLSFSKVNRRIELSVQDNGQGFDLEVVRSKAGVGLVSMRERAENTGGIFQIKSAPGRGTLVRAWWPV
jgi:PAS domain S-box-containing protein